MDDYVFASYSSSKIKTKTHEFNESKQKSSARFQSRLLTQCAAGDAMVRELDQSRITLRLLEHIDREGKGSEKNVIAKLSGPTLQTLQKCLYTATPLVLRDDEGHESRVTVKLKFIPVKMKLNPSESFRNMGNLKVEVLDGANLPAADRNGYSDPYCKFFLNGKEIHKTEKKDKTLSPVWNETFDIAVRSRTAAKFEVQVFDWDMGSSDDFLGKGSIDLTPIEPYQRKEVNIPLDGKSGTIRLRLLFAPDWISRTRQGSSTFHGTMSTATKVAGAPVKGVTRGVSAVGGGVSKASTFLGKSFRRRKSRAGSEIDPDEDRNGLSNSTPPPLPTGAPLVDGENGSVPGTPGYHNRSTSAAASRLSFGGGLSPNGASSLNGGGETGNATIHLLSSSGFPPSSNIRVTVKMETPGKGAKEVLKTRAIKSATGDVKFENEAVNRIACSAETPFRVTVVDHHTLGSDKELGEAVFHLSDQGSGGEQTVRMHKGEGQIIVRSSFEPADKASIAGSSRLSIAKFGLGSKRDGRERSVTPGA
jgi:Ca2+-dependent lipid-binding protein